MKRFSTAAVLVTGLFAACTTARTQGGPQVIAVPADEMSRQPSLSPATTAQPAPSAAPVAAPAAPVTTAAAPSAPAAPKFSYTSCHVDGPYIAMTFDDGPSAEQTPKLLDLLKAKGIKATFFMVGQNAAQYPDIVKRMVAEGHEVANHSWSHPQLTKLSADGVARQIEDTNKAIFDACGVKPVVMRPPYGATNASLNKRYHDQYGLKVIIWSVDPLDWKYRNSGRVASQIIAGAHPGAIILAHDIHPTTVAAMPEVFDTLLAKGYKFATVSELIAMDRPEEIVKKEAPPAAPAATPAAPVKKKKKKASA